MQSTAPQRFNAAILLFALAVGGCAGVPPPPLPSEELRREIGTLGVVALPSKGTTDPETPTRGAGEGAAAGAKIGALGSISICRTVIFDTSGLSALLCAAGIAVAPLAAAVGAGVGAVRARTPAEVEAAQASLVAVLESARPDIELRDRVARYARHLVVVKALTDTAGSAAEGRAGVDTVLELHPTLLGVITEGEISPSLKVTLGVRGILISGADGRGLYVRSWVYRGEGSGYFDLGAEGGVRLKTELEQAYEHLAEKIVHDLFVATVPASKEREKDGTAWAIEASELAGWLAVMPRIGTCFAGKKITPLRLDGKKLPLERGDLTLSPGRHQMELACASREGRPGYFQRYRCGRLDFVAEPGVLYRPDWPAPDRLSMIEERTGRAVGAAETWQERRGLFDFSPCAK